VPTFCRHNRFVADCPICSKGTVLDRGASPSRRPRPSRAGRKAAPAPEFKGKFASVGPYRGDDGEYELRLERVPGGLRLAAWTAGAIARSAPVLALDDLPRLLASAAEKGLLEGGAQLEGEPEEGATGASPGRAGELREELRAERLPDDRLRIARWILRPGRGWELQEAPVMLPAERYLEALGRLASGQPDAARH